MPINEKDQIVTSLKVNPELWKQAKIEALKCDITLGELIDQAVRDWIEKQEKRKK
jgi:predicted HicB family RNase H-like nuclease